MWSYVLFCVASLTLKQMLPSLCSALYDRARARKERATIQTGENKHCTRYWFLLGLHTILIRFYSSASVYERLNALCHFCKMKWHYFQRLFTYSMRKNKESDQRMMNEPYLWLRKKRVKFLIFIMHEFCSLFLRYRKILSMFWLWLVAPAQGTGLLVCFALLWYQTMVS